MRKRKRDFASPEAFEVQSALAASLDSMELQPCKRIEHFLVRKLVSTF